MSLYLKRITYLASLVIVLAALQACGATSSSDDPELNDVGVIDTGNSDSANTDDLEVDADENGGDFTIYWAVDTNDDYLLRVFINDRDRISDAITIFSMACDPDDDCHDEQNLDCDFQNDLTLECEDFDGDETERDLDSIIDGGSEDLHIIVEACDPFGFGCEDRSVEVRFRD